MGKEKRKARLNKGESGEFIGFGAFATTATPSSSLSSTTTTVSNNATTGDINNNNNNNSKNNNKLDDNKGKNTIQLSPVYTGSDSSLSLLFQRIGKRDTTTRTKALCELESCFQGEQQPKRKKVLVEALAHFLYLYYTKLHYDTSAAVRATSLKCLLHAYNCIPKAFLTLTKQRDCEILGMIYCARVDPSTSDVAQVASMLCNTIMEINKEYDSTTTTNNNNKDTTSNSNSNTTTGSSSNQKFQAFEKGIWCHVLRILSFGRPKAMHEALFAKKMKTTSTPKDNNSNNNNNNNSSSSKKSKGKDNKNKNNATTTMSESQKDEMEERYERIAGTTINGIQMWIRQQQQQQQQQDSSNTNTTTTTCLDMVVVRKVLWKAMTDSKSSLRRKTYSLLTTCCQQKKITTTTTTTSSSSSSDESLLYYDPDKIKKMLAQSLSSEKDPFNISTLIESILSYLSRHYPPHFHTNNNNNNNNRTSDNNTNTNTNDNDNSNDDNKKEDSSEEDDGTSLFWKPLIKLLKRGCYGATASQWAPTLLPLLAMVPPTSPSQPNLRLELQSSILSAAWEGRTNVVGITDRLEVVNAVAESATFLLLQKKKKNVNNNNNNNNNNNKQQQQQQKDDKEGEVTAVDDKNNNNNNSNNSDVTKIILTNIATCWLDALKLYLSTVTKGGGIAYETHQRLYRALARDLAQLDQVSFVITASDGTYREFSIIKDWFWGQGLRSILLVVETNEEEEEKEGTKIVSKGNNDVHNKHLATLITELTTRRRRQQQQQQQKQKQKQVNERNKNITERPLSHLVPVLRDIFHDLLSKFQGASGLVPTRPVYDVWVAILRLVGVDAILVTDVVDDNDDDKESTITTTKQNKLEKVVMNDILRWMVIHTSSLSELANEVLTKQDFLLFYLLCLQQQQQPTTLSTQQQQQQQQQSSLPLHKQKLWDSILHELVSAKCDLSMLVAGLVALWDEHNRSTTINETSTTTNLTELITCKALDSLAIQVAQDALNGYSHHHHHHHHDSKNAEEVVVEDDHSEATREWMEIAYQKTANFLQTCVGLCEIEHCLLNTDVIAAWIDSACPKSNIEQRQNDNNTSVVTTTNFFGGGNPNPVLETLLLLVRNRVGILMDEQVNRILSESWRQGGDLWHSIAIPILDGNEERKSCIVAMASTELRTMLIKNDLSSLHSTSNEDVTEGETTCMIWSERALRILNICGLGNEEQTTKLSMSLPSLTLVGLDDMNLWRQNEGDKSHMLCICLMNLISKIPNPTERLKVLQNSETDTSDLVVQLLLAVSEAKDDALQAEIVRRRNDGCANLLNALGGKDLEYQLVESWCRKTISILASSLTLNDDNEKYRIGRGIAVLSQLIDLIFPRLLPSTDGLELSKTMLKATEVNEGDVLWYIVNKDEPAIREEATVVKVHSDLPAEVYFTIRLDRNGDVMERQTVVERLRKAADDSSTGDKFVEEIGVPVDKVTSEERANRRGMVDTILVDLVRPFSEKWTLLSFELLNIVICQCGLIDERGVGSTHNEILRLLLSLQGSLKSLFDDPGSNDTSTSASTRMLWALAFALGYGCNAPSSEQTSSRLLGFNPTDSVSSIVKFYSNNDNIDTSAELDHAVAAWLVVATSNIESIELQQEVVSLLFRLSVRLTQHGADGENKFQSYHFISLRAIQAAQVTSHEVAVGESVVQEDEAEALSEMVKSFATKWENERVLINTPNYCIQNSEHDSQPVWRLLPYFPCIMDASLGHRSGLMAAASRRSPNDIVRTLFVDYKRWYCFRLLDSYACAGIPIYDNPESASSKNEVTMRRVKDWCDGLTKEEGEELEEDVGVSSQWLPMELMNEIESWDDDGKTGSNQIGDAIVRGRMLAWLTLLRISDVAATKDTINRPALTSYIYRCHAANNILNMVLSYANLGNDRKQGKSNLVIDHDEILSDENTLELSKLARLVIFRTVEVFPTLSKNWWEMECPKYFAQHVREFVEVNVSPEILRRELARIKKAVTFGDMTVTGSSVSREVTATYVQDDFTLSVAIRLPLSFPFRSAEVDCSKTLGVPETRWKRWSLQIKLMLNNQGGTLQDALMLWKENVDKEFEGVEPCPVCYSVLHVKTHKLPELECKTCHNRFHFDCLTQWFRSSGKSACVLCQQPWSGTRVS